MEACGASYFYSNYRENEGKVLEKYTWIKRYIYISIAGTTSHFELRDRFKIVDSETGYIHDPPDYLDGPYEYCPVPNEYGSSKYFHTRNLLPSDQLLQVPYTEVEAIYGNTLVVVASIEKRWQAMVSHLPITVLQSLMPIQYCLLELIGRSRENGQMTIGMTNLTNVLKEPKICSTTENV